MLEEDGEGEAGSDGGCGDAADAFGARDNALFQMGEHLRSGDGTVKNVQTEHFVDAFELSGHQPRVHLPRMNDLILIK
jgi:hypothetical protein